MDDSGKACFMIVVKFFHITLTENQLHNLTMLRQEEKFSEVEMIRLAKELQLKTKYCRLKAAKLPEVRSPIIARGKDHEFFIMQNL